MTDEPDWVALAGWWRQELAGDPAYTTEITPLVLDLLGDQRARTVLDVGCGEGRVMGKLRQNGVTPIGLELAESLAMLAVAHGPTVVARLPGIPLANDSVDAAFSALVLEHLADHEGYFSETARVVAPGGALVVVINHPIWTAPGSTPIRERDGEVTWRPGEYFSKGWSDETAGEGKVRFYHRPMETLLGSAADAGWSLQRLVEKGATAEQIGEEPGLRGQEHFPRLLAVRWEKRT
ncbi:MAG: methyltransferase domain-containing protein [Acidimicrobiia bacterium]|nr:methyltransferase domain-containing protein [Acidimicrobiia bacterium]